MQYRQLSVKANVPVVRFDGVYKTIEAFRNEVLEGTAVPDAHDVHVDTKIAIYGHLLPAHITFSHWSKSIEIGTTCLSLTIYPGYAIHIGWVGSGTAACRSEGRLPNVIRTRELLLYVDELAQKFQIRLISLYEAPTIDGACLTLYSVWKHGHTFYQRYGYDFEDPEEGTAYLERMREVGALSIQEFMSSANDRGEAFTKLIGLNQRVTRSNLALKAFERNVSVSEMYIFLFEVRSGLSQRMMDKHTGLLNRIAWIVYELVDFPGKLQKTMIWRAD